MGLPEEVEYLVLALLLKDREAALAFNLTCKRNTKFVWDIAFWRLALSSQGRQIPAKSTEDANSISNLASIFHRRVYAKDFLIPYPGGGQYLYSLEWALIAFWPCKPVLLQTATIWYWQIWPNLRAWLHSASQPYGCSGRPYHSWQALQIMYAYSRLYAVLGGQRHKPQIVYKARLALIMFG